jgi:hypothetical protein
LAQGLSQNVAQLSAMASGDALGAENLGFIGSWLQAGPAPKFAMHASSNMRGNMSVKLGQTTPSGKAMFKMMRVCSPSWSGP